MSEIIEVFKSLYSKLVSLVSEISDRKVIYVLLICGTLQLTSNTWYIYFYDKNLDSLKVENAVLKSKIDSIDSSVKKTKEEFQSVTMSVNGTQYQLNKNLNKAMEVLSIDVTDKEILDSFNMLVSYGESK